MLLALGTFVGVLAIAVGIPIYTAWRDGLLR